MRPLRMAEGGLLHLGAYGIGLDPGGRLLLVRMSQGPDAGWWTLPGGGVLWGESPEQALRREMAEETGLQDIGLSSSIQVYSHLYQGESGLDPVHHVGIVFHVKLAAFAIRAEVGGSTDQPCWVSESQARNLPLTPLGQFGVDLVWGQA